MKNIINFDIFPRPFWFAVSVRSSSSYGIAFKKSLVAADYHLGGDDF
jgi:hypothetical protein